jgi:hypothetical protein
MHNTQDSVTRFSLVLVAFCALLVSCGTADNDPEAALRAWVADAERLAEEKDRRGLLAMISENYADSRGNDYERIGRVMQAYFLRQRSIALLTGIDEIQLLGDTAALVKLTVGMAGTNNSRLGISADAYEFELELEVDDDDWLLIGASWGELGAGVR